jgi:hypothetical protein
MKTEPPADAATGSRITLTVDAILPIGGFEGSRLFRRGEPTPYASAEDVPENLKAYIAASEADAEPEQNFANYSPGVAYYCDADGRRGRALRRQAGELAGAIAAQEWAEAEATAPLDEQTAAALAIAQEQHAVDVAVQIKSLESRARDRDGLPEAIMAERDEEAKREREARVTIPAPVLEERPEPKRRRK